MKKLIAHGSLLIGFAISLLFLSAMSCPAADVTLAWDANTEADLAGYRLYQAEKIGDVTTAWEQVAEIPAGTEICTVTVDDDKDYAWLLTAFDSKGNESFPSNMAELVKQPDKIPPGHAKNLRKQ